MSASIARSTANRALHLRITPRPSNLGESREILQLLSGFGEIEYFKNLKYDTLTHPNIALVIFKEEAAATHCSKKAPIRFRMGKAVGNDGIYDNEPALSNSNASSESQEVARPPRIKPSPPSNAPFGLSQTRSMSTASYQPTIPEPPPRAPVRPFDPPKPTMLEPRLFQIQTSTARSNFRDQINMGGYHGNFSLDNKSMAQRDLQKSVPVPGMSCVNWRPDARPWRLMQREKEQEQKAKTLWQLHKEGPEGAATFRDESLPG
ncbi:hypothetical protein CLAFUW4_04301 [Fulvia fulva]|uniref:RRM domain-containing protein n=1 Tax=Passalora fulva TaxID=5499 RepID=A0A9Q8P821_PASFU|nr:uncharacterized protein CLAFUR5_04265 [Fulvia fulva]KAK4626057.1 hypothetical protein CLAFUR4_04287 [Fulvia fulva]KAK4628492.1 hypothetical protein CLAFUR0_04289 [Fulvia fulva]UJO16694.1 hypothetical protein CLAFUR5_04265 [Fulvia fulva]WPV14183.1 hypothetical protein CLAFUW4_04301 [Fulvia fulva]WPV28422.1 hypothetical protein CLAFUW7_04290 [Fulvia fulva]